MDNPNEIQNPYPTRRSYPSKPWSPKPQWKSKTKEISDAVERKEKNIKKFTDLKSVSIAVSSAFNTASDLTNILVDKGLVKMVDDKGVRNLADYDKAHQYLFEHFFDRFQDAQDSAKEMYFKEYYAAMNVAGRKADLHQENADLGAMDEIQLND